MTDFTAGAPMDELMGQLAAVQARAAALAQGLQACEAELPDETQGTDPTGVARVQGPPGNRLEALKGDRLGQYSIRINDQWRVCFRWSDAGADDVEIVDYH